MVARGVEVAVSEKLTFVWSCKCCLRSGVFEEPRGSRQRHVGEKAVKLHDIAEPLCPARPKDLRVEMYAKDGEVKLS